jgi:hypothetical protein
MRDINLTAAFLCGVQDLFGGSLPVVLLYTQDWITFS